MNKTITASLSLAASLLLTQCATQMSNDPNPPRGTPEATVRVSEFKASYYGSASTGSGIIRYQGRDRRFSISGVGAGGAGAQSINAVGKVYHLRSLEDFPGTFTGASSGLTLINGTMHERFENANGVVMYLTGETSGLSTSYGIEKIVISFK
jgi:hypothetical protein